MLGSRRKGYRTRGILGQRQISGIHGRLRHLRRDVLRATQEEVAAQFGADRKTVAYYEGQRRLDAPVLPTLDYLIWIAENSGADIHWIITGVRRGGHGRF